jgi:hypothetical protein
VELFYAPGTLLDEVAERLRERPEVVEAWSVTGEADAIARVRTQDNATSSGSSWTSSATGACSARARRS